jgi:exodeoxyribonuclease VII small subunit
VTVAEQPASFEQLYAALEQAVDRLEAGGLPLDAAIDAYEEGVRLARACRELLDAAELRVTTLAEALDGAARPLVDGDDDAEDADDEDDEDEE